MAIVQLCIFFPAYCGQEACGVCLMDLELRCGGKENQNLRKAERLRKIRMERN